MIRQPSFSELSLASGQDSQHPLSSVLHCSSGTTALQGRTLGSLSLLSGVSLFICLPSGVSYLISTLLETSAFCGVLKLKSSLNKLALH